MKRFKVNGFGWWLVAAASLSSLGMAAPRVGEHAHATRLVFDLPKAGPNAAVTAARTQAGRLTVQLRGAALPAGSGKLSAKGASAYVASAQQLSLRLTRAGTPKVQLLSHPARLVIDVPTSGALLTAPAKTKTTASVPGRPVIRSASTRRAPIVVIDPGHGGVDPGMVSRWVTEKDVTLDIALKVRQRLKARGVEVILTRERDTQLSTDKATDLNMRSRMATNRTVNAYISIHVNAGGPNAQGIETYYFGAPMSGSNRSLAVAENGGGSVGRQLTAQANNTAQSLLGDLVTQAKLTFSRNLAAQVQRKLVASTGAVNRGVLSDAFYVIRNPTTPAILTEVGFGSNGQEGPKLALPAYRSRLADAIADAIAEYLHVS